MFGLNLCSVCEFYPDCNILLDHYRFYLCSDQHTSSRTLNHRDDVVSHAVRPSLWVICTFFLLTHHALTHEPACLVGLQVPVDQLASCNDCPQFFVFYEPAHDLIGILLCKLPKLVVYESMH